MGESDKIIVDGDLPRAAQDDSGEDGDQAEDEQDEIVVIGSNRLHLRDRDCLEGSAGR